jgi:DNA polymerase-3 subunit delta
MIQAARAGAMKKASRPFLNLMALCGLNFEDLSSPTLRKKVAEDVDGEPAAWLNSLVDYCREQGLHIAEKKDDADSLKTAMDRGFPEGHRLLITTDFIDRRKALFKSIQEAGTVVDCTVPRGESRADRIAQDAVMQATMDDVLAKAGKTMHADARQRLMQMTGFDLRMLEGNLEKLISFVDGRKRISDVDVTAVLQRTRKDPIFEFTNAIAERSLPDSLLLMQRLLDDDMHPLQLLAAIANQLRRLLIAKDFINRDGGHSWSGHLTFPQFKSAPFKAVQDADEKLTTLVQVWESVLNPSSGTKKRKTTASSDLILVKNAKSPFPVFQTLKKADHFSLDALRSAMIDLSDIDLRMKSTGQDPRTLLEAFLIRMCGKKQDRLKAEGRLATDR